MHSVGHSLHTMTGAVTKARLRSDVTAGTGKSCFERILKQKFRPDDSNGSRRSKVIKSLTRLGERSHEINNMLNRLLSGSNLNNSELLALQGVILNFNRDLTTVSKIVEQFVGGIKTTLNTQV